MELDSLVFVEVVTSGTEASAVFPAPTGYDMTVSVVITGFFFGMKNLQAATPPTLLGSSLMHVWLMNSVPGLDTGTMHLWQMRSVSHCKEKVSLVIKLHGE